MSDEARGVSPGPTTDEEDALRQSLDEVLGFRGASSLRSMGGAVPADSMRTDLFDVIEREAEADMSSSNGLTQLRQQSAGRRLALVMAMAALMLLGAALRQWLGKGLWMAPPRVWVNTAVVLSLVTVGLWSALRPLHRPEPPAWLRWGLLVVGLSLPLFNALVPFEANFGGPPSLSYDPVRKAVGCLLLASLTAAPVFGVWLLSRRAGRLRVWPALLTALSASLVGVLSLDFHCTAMDSAHLFVGHAPTVFFYVAALAVVVFRPRA